MEGRLQRTVGEHDVPEIVKDPVELGRIRHADRRGFVLGEGARRPGQRQQHRQEDADMQHRFHIKQVS